jgi:hypothetical protein
MQGSLIHARRGRSSHGRRRAGSNPWSLKTERCSREQYLEFFFWWSFSYDVAFSKPGPSSEVGAAKFGEVQSSWAARWIHDSGEENWYDTRVRDRINWRQLREGNTPGWTQCSEQRGTASLACTPSLYLTSIYLYNKHYLDKSSFSTLLKKTLKPLNCIDEICRRRF